MSEKVNRAAKQIRTIMKMVKSIAESNLPRKSSVLPHLVTKYLKYRFPTSDAVWSEVIKIMK